MVSPRVISLFSLSPHVFMRCIGRMFWFYKHPCKHIPRQLKWVLNYSAASAGIFANGARPGLIVRERSKTRSSVTISLAERCSQQVGQQRACRMPFQDKDFRFFFEMVCPCQKTKLQVTELKTLGQQSPCVEFAICSHSLMKCFQWTCFHALNGQLAHSCWLSQITCELAP